MLSPAISPQINKFPSGWPQVMAKQKTKKPKKIHKKPKNQSKKYPKQTKTQVLWRSLPSNALQDPLS